MYTLPAEAYFQLHMASFLGISFVFAFYCYIYSNGISKLITTIDGKRIEIQTILRILEHDIANPLNVALLAAERLKKKDPENQMLAMIVKSIKTMGAILKSARTFDQLESGKQGVEIESANVEHVLKGALEQVRTQAQEKGIVIYFQPLNVNVVGNSLILVNQVFVNLLSNAIKFSPEDGSIDIKCSFEGKDVKVSIIDYGIGIPANMISNLFRPDVKTTREGTKGEAGTGFGLPIVKTCLQKFKGGICVSSTTKNGENTTRFDIRLPQV